MFLGQCDRGGSLVGVSADFSKQSIVEKKELMKRTSP